MLKLGRVTKVKVLFLVLVFVFNFALFKFSAAIHTTLSTVEPLFGSQLEKSHEVFWIVFTSVNSQLP